MSFPDAMRRFEHSTFNYDDFGYLCNQLETNIALPKSYAVKQRRVVVGNGREDFLTATDLMMSFAATNRSAWLKMIAPTDGSLRVNMTVATLSRFYNTFLWSLNPCRILSVVRDKPYKTIKPASGSLMELVYGQRVDTISRRGRDSGTYSEVVYSTLDGHLIAGEEAFRVYMEPRSPAVNRAAVHEVYYEIISYSRGCGLLGSLMIPFVRPLQNKFLDEHCASMKFLMSKRR